MQSYQTVKSGGEAVLTEKKSRFIGRSAHAETEEGALAFIAAVRKGDPQASHHVYAYILREGARTRYSDDGEPQKTAGLPVLEVLRGKPVTDTVLVVSRYFGGTLLGTGGLVRAYTAAAQNALVASVLAQVSVCVELRLSLPYALYESARKMIESAGVRSAEALFEAEVSLCWRMSRDEWQPLAASLSELTGGTSPLCSEPFYGVL